MPEDSVSASELKARSASVLERVTQQRRAVTVTKRGRPVARLVPIEDGPPRSLLGFAKGMVTVHGDLLEPLDVAWEAME